MIPSIIENNLGILDGPKVQFLIPCTVMLSQTTDGTFIQGFSIYRLIALKRLFKISLTGQDCVAPWGHQSNNSHHIGSIIQNQASIWIIHSFSSELPVLDFPPHFYLVLSASDLMIPLTDDGYTCPLGLMLSTISLAFTNIFHPAPQFKLTEDQVVIMYSRQILCNVYPYTAQSSAVSTC